MPPKKKGAKKGASAAKAGVQKEKITQLSEADRRAAAIEAAQKMLAERIATDKANIEQQEAKVGASWAHVLRLAKVEGVHESVEHMSAEHERQCLVREAKIKQLESDLKEAEETHRAALHGFNLRVDRVMALHLSRIEGLEGSFDEAVKEMYADHQREMEALRARHRTDKRELKALVATISEAETMKTLEAEQNHVTLMEELRGKATDRITLLSHQLDDRIVDLETEFEKAHLAYLHHTDAKTESFKALVAENAKAERRIERRSYSVDRAKAALVSLRNKMASTQREYEEKNAALAQQKAEQQAYLSALKGRLESFRTQGDSRLNTLSRNAASARGTLDAQLGLASRVLSLAERCRQLEGEEERVMPFPIPDVASGPTPGSMVVGPHASVKAAAAALAATGQQYPQQEGGEEAGWERPSTPTASVEAAVVSAGGLVPPEMTPMAQGFMPLLDGIGTAPATAGGVSTATAMSIADATARLTGPLAADTEEGARAESALIRSTLEDGELEALDLFWRRFNQGLMGTMAWENRRAQLAEENRRLHEILRTCVEGSTLSDRALSRAEGNPLMAINGRVGVNTPLPLIGQMAAAASAETQRARSAMAMGSPYTTPSPAMSMHFASPPSSGGMASTGSRAASGRASAGGGLASKEKPWTAEKGRFSKVAGGPVRTLFDYPAAADPMPGIAVAGRTVSQASSLPPARMMR